MLGVFLIHRPVLRYPPSRAADLYKKMFLQGDRNAMEAQLDRLQRKGSILDVVLGQSSRLSNV